MIQTKRTKRGGERRKKEEKCRGIQKWKDIREQRRGEREREKVCMCVCVCRENFELEIRLEYKLKIKYGSKSIL